MEKETDMHTSHGWDRRNKLKDMDIVYFVKEDMNNEELRYSLRSVEKNFPHRRVWFCGGCPKGIHPDGQINVRQYGSTKWDKVRNMMRLVGTNSNISEDFVLFNDDFFIMKPINELPPYYRCTLYEHIIRIEMKHGDKPNNYTALLRDAVRELEACGKGTNSYELHIPIIINRHKLLEILGAFPNTKCTRTLYGNYHEIGGNQMDDVKIYESGQEYDRESPMLSTEDTIFATHDVGKFIRETFGEKSRFEE